MDSLNEIDADRHDAEAICARLNEYDSLDETEQEKYLGIGDYSGLNEAGHVFTELLGESHNATSVLRNLDGTLMLLWEELPDAGWHAGPLYRDHMSADGDLPDALADAGLDLDLALVRGAISRLPVAPGPVRSY